MSKLAKDFPIVAQSETCMHNIQRISTFRHRAEFMQRFLSATYFFQWQNDNAALYSLYEQLTGGTLRQHYI